MANVNVAKFWDNLPKSGRNTQDSMTADRVKFHANRIVDHFLTKLPIPLAEGDNVLEWGCGGGLPALEIAKTGSNVVLLDIAPTSLKWASELLAQNGLEDKIKGEILTDEEGQLPLRKLQECGPYTGIICSSVIHHFPSIAHLEYVGNIWIGLQPDWLAFQFKPTDKNKETKDYKNNHCQSVYVTRDFMKDLLPGYSIHNKIEELGPYNGEMQASWVMTKDK